MRYINYLGRAASLAALFFFTCGNAANADLVGYWSFDDETADDLSGNDNHGVVNGNVEFRDDTPNDTGMSVYFFGENDGSNVLVPHSDSLGMADTMSIAYWIKADNADQGTENWNGPMSKSFGNDPPAGWEFQRFDAESRLDIRIDTDEQGNSVEGNLTGTFDDIWTHVAWTVDNGDWASYLDGALVDLGTYPHGSGFASEADFVIGCRVTNWCVYVGSLDEIGIWDNVLTEDEIAALADGQSPVEPAGALFAGDSDMNYEFNQLDLVQVQVAAKYLTGQAATWGEGDWNGAPGGQPGNPPAGNGFFDQLDIVAALGPGHYLKGPYNAISTGGNRDDGQTSVIYDATTGELAVNAPSAAELTSINIDSAAGIFTGDAAQNLGGSFDNDADNNIFKATFGSSFGSLSFGNVAQAGLSEEFVANDLTVVGSLAGGGALGDVDLIYVPEPSTILLIVLGAFLCLGCRRK